MLDMNKAYISLLDKKDRLLFTSSMIEDEKQLKHSRYNRIHKEKKTVDILNV